MAADATNALEDSLSGPDIGGLPASGGGGMVEHVPFHHVEFALRDFLAIAVTIRVIHADARARPPLAQVLAGRGRELLRSRVGHQTKAIAERTREGSRVAGLKALM